VESGPAVARLFQRLLALAFLTAWVSLGREVDLLIGRRGLEPLEPFLEAARAQGGGFAQIPTLFWMGSSDGVLRLGIGAGVLLGLLALVGAKPRLCFALSTLLYLSYVSACRSFLAFQWDNLLLECGALAVLLPRDRPAPTVHLLFRILLFKLYFESGLAKWQSPLGDWRDGSAMTYYYETAPLPTWLAWYAHHLPVGWHHFESFATLVLELVLPLAAFGPRQLRLPLAGVLTGFQAANALTANYGFFCYLAAALHVFLLDDRDLRRWPTPTPTPTPTPMPTEKAAMGRRGWGAAVLVLPLYIAISFVEGWLVFGPPAAWLEPLLPLRLVYAPLRIVNTYHLFAQVTRERIEPELQTSDGTGFTPRHLKHKPGDPARAPDFVAPLQPRVDFQLWFYGLGFERHTPRYVLTLVDRLCHDPSAVARLFAAPLDPHPKAVRIAFFNYRFTTRAERRVDGAWWRRELKAASRDIACDGQN
jgi:hypothetical protein